MYRIMDFSISNIWKPFTFGFLVMLLFISVLLSCQRDKVALNYSAQPISVSIDCSRDTLISLDDSHISLMVSKETFECIDEYSSVELKVFLCNSKSEMIKQNISTIHEDGNYLQSLGMIRLQVVNNSINSSYPIKVIYDQKNDYSKYSTFEMNSKGDWMEPKDYQNEKGTVLHSVGYNGAKLVTPLYDENGELIRYIEDNRLDSMGNTSDTKYAYLIELYNDSWYNIDAIIEFDYEIPTPILKVSDSNEYDTHAVLTFRDRNTTIIFEPFGDKFILKGNKGKRSIKWPMDERVSILAYQVSEKGNVIKAGLLDTIFNQKQNAFTLELEKVTEDKFEDLISSM